MRSDDAQLGKPSILYKDTKANVEALAGVAEGAIAYATDTNELGTYSGAAWTWGQGGGTLDSLTDVNVPSPTTGNVLYWNGSVWINYDPNLIFDRAWGSMYQDDIGTLITVGASDTDYIVTGMSEGVLGNMTFQNAKELVIAKEGIYQVVWSVSFTTAGANQEIEGAVGVGGVRQASTSAHRKSVTGADTGNISGTGLLSLLVGNLIQIVVRNETSAGNITIQHANLSLVFLGLTPGNALLGEDGNALLGEDGNVLIGG